MSRSARSLLTGAIRRADRAITRKRFRHAVRRLAPIAIPAESPVEVHLLYGRRGRHEVVATLWSLFRWLPAPWAVTLHEDGSLTEADRELISHHLPGARSLDGNRARTSTVDWLDQRGLSRCAALRASFVLAPKLFDVAIAGAGKTVLLLDTDILFLRRPDALVDAAAARPFVARYNEDVVTSYSYSWTAAALGEAGVAIPPRVNSGLVLLRPDPETLFPRYEEWIAALGKPSDLHTMEQTLIALALGLEGAAPLPPDYDVAFRLARHGQRPTTQHYCGGQLQRDDYYREFLRARKTARAGE